MVSFSVNFMNIKVFVRFVCSIGICAMAAICFPSCQTVTPESQQATSNYDEQQSQESADIADTVQTATESDAQVDTNDEHEADQNTSNDVDSEHTIADTDDDASDDVTQDDEVRPQSSRLGSPKTMRSQSDNSDRKANRHDPASVNKELSELNRIIQEACHPKAGTFKVEFTLTPSGKVKDAQSIGGSLKETDDEACILKKLSNHQFSSKSEDSVPVKYPFVFK